MNNEPMWSKDDFGNYCLMFPNKHAHSIPEIKEIFSEFGKIKNVTAAGDEKGYRFVQFSSLEDVERAAENLKDHPTIKLLPHRIKKKNNKSNSALKGEENNSSTNENEVKRNFYQRKPLKRDSITSNNGSISPNDNQFQKVVNTNQSNSIHEMKNALRQIHVTDDSSYSGSQKAANISSVNSPTKKAIELLKLRGTNANSFLPPRFCNDTDNVVSGTYADKIPDLVTKNQIMSSKEPRKEIFNAEEIIVANIHCDYGSAYILHLFEQFEPLAISYIKVLPKTETRYCHVYFKTAQDSVSVETQFDKYNLSGKKLVVSRPCTLMEEAMS